MKTESVERALRSELDLQGGGCADSLLNGEVVPDPSIYWFHGHQINIAALARAAIADSRRMAETTGGPLQIDLSWPAKELSPNTSVHHMVLHRFKKAAKLEAMWATKIAMPFHWSPGEGRIPVHLIAHPPKAWRTGDDDNLVSRCKAILDGIAETLGVNDREFQAPTVTWGDRCERGKLIVEIGQ